jgi:hypothetical protein
MITPKTCFLVMRVFFKADKTSIIVNRCDGLMGDRIGGLTLNVKLTKA